MTHTKHRHIHIQTHLEVAELNGNIQNALELHLLDHRHQQTLGCVHGQADVVVAVVDHLRAVLCDRGVQHGIVGQSLQDDIYEDGIITLNTERDVQLGMTF